MMNRRVFTLGLCGCAVGALSGCATTQTSGPSSGLANTAPRYRPDPASDEAGLWMMVDKLERDVRTSPVRVRDKTVNALINDMMCRLVGDYCPDLRSYVMRIPMFQATCNPNGMVQVYTGLLLRCGSESQLAAVMGHEFGHYLRRHSLQRRRDDKEWNETLLISALGVNSPFSASMHELSEMVARASRMKFSRDHERESDEIGFRLMVRAGYDPGAAAAIWKRVIEEDKAGDLEERFDLFTATHPPTDERIDTLTELAAQHADKGRNAPDRLADAIAPIRGMLMMDELNLGHFKQTEVVFNRLLAAGRDPGEVLYYKGELHRRRGKDGDESIALGFYHEACEASGAPPEAFRSVGLMRWRRGEKEQAREYFRRYLHVKPDAGDREMITNYLMGA